MAKIVLIGYMGSGKSTVGKQLSETLSIPFLDLDQKIEKETGLSISEVFEKKGEIYFRNKESQILFKLLDEYDPAIIATGGGTPCYGDTMKKLQGLPGVTTVYLNVALDQLVSRLVSEKHDRPLISHLSDEVAIKDFVRKHLFERAYYYNQADRVIKADAHPQDIIKDIVATLF